jgi:hypothetical protein
MTMRGALLLLLMSVAALPACGGSYIVLEIGADLEIPTQADSLQVITLDATDLGKVLSNVDLPLDAGDAFPIEVLLEPADGTPKMLRERVFARLNGVAVAEAEVEHPWTVGKTNRAAFLLNPVP